MEVIHFFVEYGSVLTRVITTADEWVRVGAAIVIAIYKIWHLYSVCVCVEYKYVHFIVCVVLQYN